MHDTCHNNQVIRLFKSLLNVELTAMRLILQIRLSERKLQIMQEILEQLNTFMRLITDTKDWANDLALHLSIDEDDIFLVVNDVANFSTNFPNLRPKFVHYVFEYILIPKSIDFAENNDNWHLELERDAKVIEDALLEFDVLLGTI